MFKLDKNEVLFGQGKTALQMVCESEAPTYELNKKLIMRKINKLSKEIANKDAILRYTWRQYRVALRSGCTPEERSDRRDRLREIMEMCSTKEERKELGALTKLLEQ